jgi:hypothetical protein
LKQSPFASFLLKNTRIITPKMGELVDPEEYENVCEKEKYKGMDSPRLCGSRVDGDVPVAILLPHYGGASYRAAFLLHALFPDRVRG